MLYLTTAISCSNFLSEQLINKSLFLDIRLMYVVLVIFRLCSFIKVIRFYLKRKMSSTATSAATSSEASLQQQQSKQQRKTLVSKILKRTTSLQPTSHDQKQSTSVNSTVALNLKNNEVADSEEIGKYSKMTYINRSNILIKCSFRIHISIVFLLPHSYFRFETKSTSAKRATGYTGGH